MDEKMVHLHIENCSKLGDIFETTQERLDRALERHPDIANKVKITMGTDGKGFRDAMSTADALFCWDFERENVTELAPSLRWIHLQGAGVNHLLPLTWVPEDVCLTNSRGVHGERASEYVFMGMLALNNRLPEMMTNQRKAKWEKLHSSRIRGKTVLIYGVGHVGGDVARIARSFGLRVIGIRRTGKDHEYVDDMYQPQDLAKLLPLADFIVVTAPHTPSTERVFGQDAFDLMKTGAGFVNYSRADLVDYAALQRVLEAGKISAVVDVFDQEPLPETSPLWQTPNLIITPHSSSNDPDHHADRSLDLLFENLGRFIDGRELKNTVDLDQQY